MRFADNKITILKILQTVSARNLVNAKITYYIPGCMCWYIVTQKNIRSILLVFTYHLQLGPFQGQKALHSISLSIDMFA